MPCKVHLINSIQYLIVGSQFNIEHLCCYITLVSQVWLTFVSIQHLFLANLCFYRTLVFGLPVNDLHQFLYDVVFSDDDGAILRYDPGLGMNHSTTTFNKGHKMTCDTRDTHRHYTQGTLDSFTITSHF